MRTKKRIPLPFTYMDCDAFSDYLHKQSLQGWHFQAFRFGMVFEAGQPQERYYDVEVFPKGMETDLRPGEEAEEYSGYCEAAGWRFIDGIRKFCVFEKAAADAVPIVTPQERFENIRRAQFQLWGRYLLGFGAEFLLMLANFSWNRYAAFMNLFVCLFLLAALSCILELLHGVFLFADLYRKKCRLAAGEIPVYASRFRHWRMRDVLPAAMILILCADYAWAQKNPAAFGYVAGYLGVILLVNLLLAYFRPHRDERFLTMLFVNVGLVCFFLLFALTGRSGSPDQDPSDRALARMPFTLADLRQPQGEAVRTDYGHSESILGSVTYCSMVYEIQETVTGSKMPDDSAEYTSDVLTYCIYQSNYPWVLDGVWKDGMVRIGKDGKSCAKEWEADAGMVSDGGIFYLIRYGDTVLELITDHPITSGQIEKITEKMGVR